MTSITAFPSAARTASPTPFEFSPGRDTRLAVTIVTTAAGTSPSTTFAIDRYDPASDTWVNRLVSAAVTATGTVVLTMYPGATNSNNLVANDMLGDRMRVRPIHGNGTSHTYSIGLALART